MTGIIEADVGEPLLLRKAIELNRLRACHVGAVAPEPDEGRAVIRRLRRSRQDGDLARGVTFADDNILWGFVWLRHLILQYVSFPL